ncbi:hypothetical protein NDU88_002399 [Pleurodeles waltl]|uniref:Uncharacterized protein n=1 Tax=Pleurodeles waltl TaxID=8319 RepID=A0AAV7M2B0_PLEWA|nr:hypothetical protein NDU88_002399 [Pleurodeles waltl]
MGCLPARASQGAGYPGSTRVNLPDATRESAAINTPRTGLSDRTSRLLVMCVLLGARALPRAHPVPGALLSANWDTPCAVCWRGGLCPPPVYAEVEGQP